MPERKTVRELTDQDFDFDLVRKDNLFFANQHLDEAGAHLDAAEMAEKEAFAAYGQHDAAVTGMDQDIADAADAAAAATQDTTSTEAQQISDSQPYRDFIRADFAYTVGISNVSLVYLTDNPPPPPVIGPEPLPPGTQGEDNAGNVLNPDSVPQLAHNQAGGFPGATEES